MAKSKKNTLSDLNKFLKHKSDLVDTEEVRNEDKKGYLKSAPHQIAAASFLDDSQSPDPSVENVIHLIYQTAENENKEFGQLVRDVVIACLNKKEDLSSSDLMLLNTVLYLNHSDNIANGYQELLDGK